jgi:uncharacterized protein (TIGR02466 family)
VNKISQENLFPTIVWTCDCDLNLAPLIDYSFLLQQKDHGNQHSNIGGWQSTKFEVDKKLDPIFDPLILKINSVVNEIATEFNFRFPLKTFEFWININEADNYNLNHTHPGSVLSGVFYLKTDSSGPLEFVMDRAEGFLWQSIVDSEKAPPITWPVARFAPAENKMIVFPSWLEHNVLPCKSQRISIAFNAVFDL